MAVNTLGALGQSDEVLAALSSADLLLLVLALLVAPLKKLGEEIEETLADVEPTAGDPQGLDVARIAQAEGFVAGDHSPAAEEEAREG